MAVLSINALATSRALIAQPHYPPRALTVMAASSSSLSSVVSKLTRASLGLSAPSAVKDEDLDRYVADLIMNEAKQSEERYKGKDGIRAYLPSSQL